MIKISGIMLAIVTTGAFANDDITNIINGEFSVNAKDSERYAFLRYQTLRDAYVEDLTECTYLDRLETSMLTAEFKDLSWMEYRDFGYCYFLHHQSQTETDVEQVNRWIESNRTEVNDYYSLEGAIKYFNELNDMTEYKCTGYRYTLSLFEVRHGSKSDSMTDYTARCEL